MKAIYTFAVPATITALAVSLIYSEERRDTPDQPHAPHSENVSIEPTTLVPWGASGTNASAGFVPPSWNEVSLVLPFESDPYFVDRLRQAGVTVVVSSAETVSHSST